MSTVPRSRTPGNRVARLVLCWPLFAFGIAVLLDARLGVGPLDVLTTGVSTSSGLGLATVYPIIAVTLLVVGSLMGGRVGVGSVVSPFVIGALIGPLRRLTPQPDALPVRWAMVSAAAIVLAAAVILIVTAELGAGPTEVVMLGLVQHRVPLVVARWISDGVPVAVGAALGGSLGVATIALVVVLGPLIRLGLGLAAPSARS